MNRVSARRGFTLIEVLVAIVILSTGIVVVLQAFQTSVVALGAARDQTLATFLIGRKLSEAESYVYDNPGQLPVSGSGSFDGQYDNFRWQQTIGALPDLPDNTDVGCDDGGLRCIRIEVWREGSEVIHVGETFLLPLPAEKVE